MPPRPTKIIDDRPGIDGSEFILTGTKGRPFQMVSQVDAESYQAAKSFFEEYKTLISGDSVTLIHGGVTSDSLGYRVSVLNVEPIRIMPIRNPVGNGLSAPSLGWIECVWDLIAVPLEE